MFLHLFAVVAVLLAAVGGQGGGAPAFTVVAREEAGEDDVARVRAAAEAGLKLLQAPFPGLPKVPFAIAVHGRREALPEHLRALHHEGSPGFALPAAQQIHLLLAEAAENPGGLRPVVVHELVHVLLHQHAAPFGEHVPRWLHEGLAQHLAGDTYLGASESELVWGAVGRSLPALSDLEADFPRARAELRLAYALSHSYVAWLVREFGLEKVLAAVDRIDDRTTADEALVVVTRRSTLELEEAWRDYLLHGSGANYRALLEGCFSFSLLLALPLLVLALMRRLAADRRAGERLRKAEEQAPAEAPMPEEQPYAEDEDEDPDDDQDAAHDDDTPDDGAPPRPEERS